MVSVHRLVKMGQITIVALGASFSVSLTANELSPMRSVVGGHTGLARWLAVNACREPTWAGIWQPR